MYKGKKTYFWNGENIGWDDDSRKFRIYNKEEMQSWQVIIVLPGVEVIPFYTFGACYHQNIEAVIMADSVRRIEKSAFHTCTSLTFVKLSINLEYIGEYAFVSCRSLTSIFIPPSCREIGSHAFWHCEKLIILHVPRQTQLGEGVIDNTALLQACQFHIMDEEDYDEEEHESTPFTTNMYGFYQNNERVNEWIKNRHAENQFSLHRACASYNPLEEVIFDIVKRQGLKAFKIPDSIGVTPSQYLLQNPFTEITEKKILKRYILDMMGELVST